MDGSGLGEAWEGGGYWEQKAEEKEEFYEYKPLSQQTGTN